MNEKLDEKRRFLHDLRSPLARAKTLAKLTLDDNSSCKYLEMLLAALEEMDARIAAELTKASD